jgi:tRNA modification GTPase
MLTDCLARGARLAEPGEFTLRAFLAGRIDLTQAEAVLGVIEARHPAQLQAALRQLAGGLSDPIRDLRGRLLDLVAHLEATLDFVEEPDVDAIGRSALASELAREAGWVAALARQFAERDRPERWPKVVLAGAPNVGKSRLFNALTGNGRALVAEHAGTTRDYLTARCHCAGLVVELIDTAGAAAAVTGDAIMAAAKERRDEQMAAADLILLCRSPDQDLPDGLLADPEGPALRVWTQADRAGPGEPDWIATSALTGAGLDALRQAIADRLHTGRPAEGEAAAMSGARCRESLTEASQALESAARAVAGGVPEDLISLDVQAAVDALGAVLGLVVSDDILDRIFSRFCIGK